jgi:hypothetical protein
MWTTVQIKTSARSVLEPNNLSRVLGSFLIANIANQLMIMDITLTGILLSFLLRPRIDDPMYDEMQLTGAWVKPAALTDTIAIANRATKVTNNAISL